jgi:hypothetical protein
MMATQTLTALLLRTSSGDQGTFGVLQSGNYSCFTGELPWRDNRRKVSCIPEGDYEVKPVKSPKFGVIYGLFGVPGRSHILLHNGNFCGDVAKGYVSHVEGCIITGSRIGRLVNKFGVMQRAVLTSLPTVRSFMAYMNGQPFVLSVRNTFH